jgi:elongation factor Ts
MVSYTAQDVKKLREETGAGMMDCKKALDAAKGNFDEAKEIVRQRGLAIAETKSDRETKAGYIASYVHANNKIAALVEILCETDFVAKNAEFQAMAKDVAMHVVAMNPVSVEDLLEDQFVKDLNITVDDLVKGVSGKIGERFIVNRFVRYEVGK